MDAKIIKDFNKLEKDIISFQTKAENKDNEEAEYKIDACKEWLTKARRCFEQASQSFRKSEHSKKMFKRRSK
jgi:hypothetical protein